MNCVQNTCHASTLWSFIIFILHLDEIRNGERARTYSAHERNAFKIMVWNPEAKKQYWSDKALRDIAAWLMHTFTFSEQGNTVCHEVSVGMWLWSLLMKTKTAEVLMFLRIISSGSSPVVRWRFGGTYCLHLQGYSKPKLRACCLPGIFFDPDRPSPETSSNLYRTEWRHIPEYGTFQIHRQDNLKSDRFNILYYDWVPIDENRFRKFARKKPWLYDFMLSHSTVYILTMTRQGTGRRQHEAWLVVFFLRILSCSISIGNRLYICTFFLAPDMTCDVSDTFVLSCVLYVVPPV
jgi:hypothetical protein